MLTSRSAHSVGRLRPAPATASSYENDDVLELDLAAQPLDVARIRPVPHVRLRVQQAEDLLERRHALLVGGVEVRELLDRIEEALEVADERDQHADRHVPVEHLVAAVEQDHAGRDGRQQLDGGEVGRVQVDRAHVCLAVLVVQLREPLAVARLLSERANHANTRERLLEVSRDVRDLLSHPPVGTGREVAERDARGRQEREGQEHDQRQLDVEQEQDHDRPDQRQRAREERHDAVGHELVERRDVVRQTRDQDAGLVAAEETDRLPLEVGEDPQPQVLERALADPADEIGLKVGRSPVQERGGDERHDDQVQRVRVAGSDAVVDRELGEVGGSEACRGRRDQRESREDHAAAVRAQELREAPQLAAQRKRRASGEPLVASALTAVPSPSPDLPPGRPAR